MTHPTGPPHVEGVKRELIRAVNFGRTELVQEICRDALAVIEALEKKQSAILGEIDGMMNEGNKRAEKLLARIAALEEAARQVHASIHSTVNPAALHPRLREHWIVMLDQALAGGGSEDV